jgi:hypothetical protein
MISINAHFDGKVLVPDEPVDLPRNEALIVRIERAGGADSEAADSCLNWLSENSVDAPSVPTDFSHQHDHYLYGLPRKDI